MKNLRSIYIGLASAFACTIILLLCFSIFLVNMNIEESVIPIFIIIFFSLSILCGSIISTRKIRKNGVKYGLLLASMYIVLIYTISSIYIGNFSVEKTSLYMIISGLLLGTIGGIIGVNLK